MQFLLSHWHCILPALVIVVAVFFMKDKPQKKKTDDNTEVIPKKTK